MHVGSCKQAQEPGETRHECCFQGKACTGLCNLAMRHCQSCRSGAHVPLLACLARTRDLKLACMSTCKGLLLAEDQTQCQCTALPSHSSSAPTSRLSGCASSIVSAPSRTETAVVTASLTRDAVQMRHSCALAAESAAMVSTLACQPWPHHVRASICTACALTLPACSSPSPLVIVSTS